MKRAHKLAAPAAALAVVVAVVLVVAWRAGRVEPPPEAPDQFPGQERHIELPFRAGERAVYRATMGDWHVADIEWTTEITHEAGRPLLKVRYRAESPPGAPPFSRFSLTYTSLLEPRTLRPVTSVDISEKPGEHKTVTMTYDHRAETALYHRVEVEDGEEDAREQGLPFGNGWDVLSGLMFVRSAYPELTAGRMLGLTMLDGRDYIELVVQHVGPEPIKVDGSVRKAQKFVLKSREHDDTPGEEPGPWRESAMWVSPEHWLPLRFDAALVMGRRSSARLVEYKPGTRPIAPGGLDLAPVTRAVNLPEELQP